MSDTTVDVCNEQHIHYIEQAIALHKNGHIREAVNIYEKALITYPDIPILLSNYGAALLDLRDFEGALKVLNRAVQLDPSLAHAWSNLGNVYQLQQNYGAAIKAYQKCLDLTPNHAGALSNLAMAISALGHFDVAHQLYCMSIEIEPDNQQTRSNYALSLLASGNYKEGFREYEWRWSEEQRKHYFSDKPWKGESLIGKKVIISTEGGFGDMIQFCRFIPQIEELGAEVVTTVRKELLSLLSYSFPNLIFKEETKPLPEHDHQILVLSLPYVLGTDIKTIPFAEGYLKAQPKKIESWKHRLRDDERDFPQQSGLKIGLVWAGAPHPEVKAAELANRRRSTDLSTFAPLAQAVPDAIFYSLQIGEKSQQANNPPKGFCLLDHTDYLHDFSDTAAFIVNLDVVVAVDTSTAHLAAALGKPVLMLSRFDQCWRWLYGHTDTPWYKSMTIYQQEQPFDWSQPLKRLCKDLRAIGKTKI
ncbi:tetratricopeptide repeat protein (plasmid) [Aristophania vespae]|uniref:Tetratricopeptide repeat protein n=1 Tax=Aristophania vespae TaxID=2697033 RepID=A0A6P1NIZ8_9PROT|nr:tetratricopeptide repeat protein [Aristophania vespae]QHI96514.1 tetratricopeptide repeat protein [Aristophania vespae]